MRFFRPALFLLLAFTGIGASPAPGPQRYRLAGGPDVASELILYPDGRFEYFLAAGALDEQAQGRWMRDGDTIRITTVPKPRAATFSAGAITREAGAPFTIKVFAPNGAGVALVDFTLDFASGAPVQGYTQDYGWSLDSDEQRKPLAVTLGIPMYGLVSQRFPIDTTKGNSFSFLLTPNDLGTMDFENVPLTVGPSGLVMHRGGGDLNYVQQRR